VSELLGLLLGLLPGVRRRREHRQRALERQDDVVQQLVVATYSLELGDVERTKTALTTALEQARAILSDLAEQDRLRGLTRRTRRPG
jgi:hypothetical protein